MLPILLALGAVGSFSLGTIFFTKYSRMASSSWMNWIKAFVATIAFWMFVIISCYFFEHRTLTDVFQEATQRSLWLWVISGSVGLFIGDIFLLQAFALLGPGRTLALFGFQPLLLGFASYFLFGQTFSPMRFVAVIFLLCSLFSFALGSMKESGHWGVKGLLIGSVGILLDSVGVLMTRQAFELSPAVSPFFANGIRATAAVVGLTLLSFGPKGWGFSLLEPLKTWKWKDNLTVVVASLFGTFISLSCYLKALKIGHIGTVSAIASTSPLFATLLEIAFGHKRFTRYVLTGCLFFAIGLFFLFYFETNHGT